MTKDPWDDDGLLTDLSHAVRDVTPLARIVADQARNVYTWRTVDEDLLLACLSFDSLVTPAGQLRAEQSEGRVLVFNSAPLSVELEVMSDQIVGQLIPPGAGRILIEASVCDDSNEVRVEAETTADERGFFVVSPLPRGRVRLRCDTETGRVVTDWVVL